MRRYRRRCKKCGADVGSPDFDLCGACCQAPPAPRARADPRSAGMVCPDGWRAFLGLAVGDLQLDIAPTPAWHGPTQR